MIQPSTYAINTTAETAKSFNLYGSTKLFSQKQTKQNKNKQKNKTKKEKIITRFNMSHTFNCYLISCIKSMLLAKKVFECRLQNRFTVFTSECISTCVHTI